MFSNNEEINEEAAEKLGVIEQIKKISDLNKKARNVKLKDYSETFATSADGDTVILGEIDTNKLYEEKMAAFELEQKQKNDEDLKVKNNIKELQETKDETDYKLAHKNEVYKRSILHLEQKSIEHTKYSKEIIKEAFNNARIQIEANLNNIKKEVRHIYKDLEVFPYINTPTHKSHRTNTPQQIEIRLEVARCIRDKLPKGHYVILCKVLDRIGGQILDTYENWDDKNISAGNFHTGDFHLNNFRFEENLYLTIPPYSKTTPSMVYLFELFMLRSKQYSHDQVLGWGVFPLLNAQLEVNTGKYKVDFRIYIDSHVVWTC